MLLKSINVYGKTMKKKTVVTLHISDGKTVEFKLGRHVAPMTSASFATSNVSI